MSEKKINNVCFHKCHEFGKSWCSKCSSFHKSKEGVYTHEKDVSNPTFGQDDSPTP